MSGETTTTGEMTQREVEDIAAIRSMPIGGDVVTAVATYAMQGESVPGECRWHSLMVNTGSGWFAHPDTPNSGRPDAVRRLAIRDYKARMSR